MGNTSALWERARRIQGRALAQGGVKAVAAHLDYTMRTFSQAGPGQDRNAALKESTTASYRVDVHGIRESVQPEVVKMVAYLADIAKAEALTFIGEREEGLRLVERHLSP